MKVKEIFQYGLGALIVIGFFLLLYLIFVAEIPSPNKELGLIVIGALVGNFNSIVGYFFGSSKGSADKTDILNKVN